LGFGAWDLEFGTLLTGWTLLTGEIDIDHQPSNIILSLDPSSTIVGYAAVRRTMAVVEAGVITPGSRGEASYARVMGMCDDLEALLERLGPGTILVEWTRGKVGQRRHGGLGAGLAVYGTGVGAIGRQAQLWARGRAGCEVVYVCENDWTRGVPKEARQAALRSLVPEYAGVEDPGGDIADALGLARWWLTEQMLLFR